MGLGHRAPVLHSDRCVHPTVHTGGRTGLTIGVIGTADPGDVHNDISYYHATAHGWRGYGGGVYLAGQWNDGHGVWAYGGWQAGDTAALTLDTATNTLTFKQRRLARAFTISLAGSVAEWFLNVSLFYEGDSVEALRMSTAEHDAFLP